MGGWVSGWVGKDVHVLVEMRQAGEFRRVLEVACVDVHGGGGEVGGGVARQQHLVWVGGWVGGLAVGAL